MSCTRERSLFCVRHAPGFQFCKDFYLCVWCVSERERGRERERERERERGVERIMASLVSVLLELAIL